ncbi:hypothetical protein Tco_0735952, partial [Tanacetum coccineum]
KKSRRKQRKDSAPTEPTTEETTPKEHVSTPSYDLPPSGKDRMQLAQLMSLYTNLQEKVLDLEKAKTAQAKEITSLKKRGRKIKDLDANAEVTLVNKTQEMNDDNLMFDTAQLQAKLIEEERLAMQKEEEANIALIESWDNTQAMMEVDFELAQRLQAEEQGEITIEERSRLFSKSYDEIQKLFDKEMKRVYTFVGMNLELLKGSETKTEESSKRVGDELESDMSKKQKIDEHVEVEKDDQEEAEMKRHIEIVKDDEVEIDVIPLATKPQVIVEYQIDKDGRMGYFKLIRADRSSKKVFINDKDASRY